MRPHYFDYAATTPVDQRVAEKMSSCLTIEGTFGNPASRIHEYGWDAEEAVDEARRMVAEAIGARPKEIVWTSGATESNNLALKGVASGRKNHGNHIITSMIEHKSILDSCSFLEGIGSEVTYLRPAADGLLDPDEVRMAIRPETILVSVMLVNNELGLVQDIAELGRITRSRGILLHCDAAQAIGKLPIDVDEMNIDLMSLCAHKVYGPKGVGALYVRSKHVQLDAQIHGGGHERNLRSGTIPTHQVVGMGEALRIAKEEMETDYRRVYDLRARFLRKLLALDGIHTNCNTTKCSPYITSMRFDNVNSRTLTLSLKSMAISTGSACTSASGEPSHVLRTIGLSNEEAAASIRFSLGRFSSQDQVDDAAGELLDCVTRLREGHRSSTDVGYRG